MNKTNFGKCALCGKECNLTFEHIPPKAAFNSRPARPVAVETILQHSEKAPWDTEGLKYTNQQKGMGEYSLCQERNNNTGSWYGEDYIKLTHDVHYIFKHNENIENKFIIFKKIYPARIIKQVLSMFCSINNGNLATDKLKPFILDKNSVGIDKNKYKICMYFTKSHVTKHNPFWGIVDTKKTTFTLVSEITSYPLGFIMYLNPQNLSEYEGIDITFFCDYSYDDCCTVQLPILLLEVNNIFPIDYRTKEEIIQCDEESME